MGTLSSTYPNSNAVEAALDRANSASHNVSLLSDTMSDVLMRLNALEYVDIAINDFTVTPSISEMGSTQTVSLAWGLNKQSAYQDINGYTVEGNSKQYTGVTNSQTYTLTVTDGQTSASKTEIAKFVNRIYWGVASNLSSVTSLTSVLSDNPERTITVNAGAGKYIIYAIPARFRDIAFYVGGFEGGFENPVSQTLTNASGYSETYRVYRSTNAGLGETTIEVREV